MSIVITDLCKRFGSTPVLQRFTWTVDRPMVLMGRSGCGKTTLLRILLGLESADSGTVTGVETPAAVFQEDRLCPQLTAAANLTLTGHGLTPQDAYMRALAGTGTPTVLLDNCVPNASVGYVGTDSWEGVELGVRHLAGLGHRKIAFLNGTRDSMVSEERRLAFLHATWLCGLSADERMMAYGYYEQNCAREYVPHFLAQGATAILCASDGIARWVLAELRRLGLRVPGDVSVMGYDDLPLAAGCEPPLTTIRQDRLALGKSAFSLLDSLMNGVAVSKVLLRPQLIVRESTGPAPVRK